MTSPRKKNRHPFPSGPVALAAALALLPAACSPDAARTAVADGPNVLIVVLDSLRTDKLGCYGFDRPTSPVLDALASDPDAVLYARHHAPATWTKPSTASLFTGLFTFQHGVQLGHTGKDKETRRYQTQALDESHDTLAERFQDAGYATFGVVKSHHLVKSYGFAQGFDDYLDPDDVTGDPALLAETLRLARDAGRPFLGYLHLSAVHYPWPVEDRDADYLAEFGFPYDEAARQVAGIDFTSPDIKHRINDGDVELTDEDTRFLHVVYESTVRRVDRELVGRLVDRLRADGLYDSTLLIVTADHGEELYDHEGFAHGHALWEEVIQVPMIVKFPKGRRPGELPDRVTDLTSTIDIVPSLLRFAGLTVDELPGSSMFERPSGTLAFAELRRRYAVIRDHFKLIGRKNGKESRLFDLRDDGGERSDLAEDQPAKAAELAALAEALRAAAKGRRTDAPVLETELDPKALDDLRQLGYIR